MREQTPEQFSPASVLQAAREECHRLRVDNDALSARCTALEQERDQAKGRTEDAVRWIDQLREELADQKARCQHLEQAVKRLIDACYGVDDGTRLEAALNIAKDALASLLPTQEEPTQTDENRVSFAAGYSTALDDVLNEKPEVSHD